MKIGITLSESKTQYYINQAYVDYVVTAGFEPVLLCPNTDLEKSMSSVGGLVLPGGIDVDPIYYGSDNVASFRTDPAKDSFEREVLDIAMTRAVPIFGICRGLQLIALECMHNNSNIAKRLKFSQHIPNHNQVDDQNLERSNFQHHVNMNIGVLYGNAVGQDPTIERRPVNSMHHQCLVGTISSKKNLFIRGNNPETGLFMLAWTSRGLKSTKQDTHDVVVEAFCLSGFKSKILAVQWHPEEVNDTNLLTTFFSSKGATLPNVPPKAVTQNVQLPVKAGS